MKRSSVESGPQARRRRKSPRHCEARHERTEGLEPDSGARKTPNFGSGGGRREARRGILERVMARRDASRSDERAITNRVGRVISDRRPSDRRCGRPGSNWHRWQSTSRARRPDGRRGWTYLPGAHEQQLPPIQIRYAQVRSSWTSVRSSTKTPHEQKRDLKTQVNAPPLP